MISPELRSALAHATGSSPDQLQIIPLAKGGLINHSFQLKNSVTEETWLLQLLNTSIFKHPEDLADNYRQLYDFSLQAPRRLKIPAPLLFENGSYLFADTQGKTWRAMQWIGGTETLEKVQNPEQAKDLAATFASFTLALTSGFKPAQLKYTLPGFHDLSFRYQQFEQALAAAGKLRLEQAATLSEEMKKRSFYCTFFEQVKGDPRQFPLRVMHHDAKISNILFEEGSGKVWGPIDLDTVMPGYFFSDLGDMIRSLAGTIDETSNDLSLMAIKEDIYETLVNAYSAVMDNEWSEQEKKYRHASGLLLVYMQTLRFLSDHLNGDIYYKVDHPGQNLERALNQFQLLIRLEEYIECRHPFSFELPATGLLPPHR